ncbi:MAG: hypothetical protein JW891_14525 [Candidatus Lokiarchaeota archaeon]|nr:hypothetical protein [Candidatus Lokiarchaeota archaeon]
MELYKKSYKAVFFGKNARKWKIMRYSMDEVLREILDYVNEGDEGIVEIHEIDVKTKIRKIVKRITIVNDLCLTPKEDIPLKF